MEEAPAIIGTQVPTHIFMATKFVRKVTRKRTDSPTNFQCANPSYLTRRSNLSGGLLMLKKEAKVIKT